MAKILVIEDDEQIRENICEQLELYNHEVKTAPDGLQALKLLSFFSPNLILCDIMMPEMDGITFIRTLKQHVNYRSIPVIFLTAKATLQDKLEGLEEGAVDYLTKPFLQKELLLKVNNITNQQAELKIYQMGHTADEELQNQFVSELTDLLEQHYGDRSLTAEKMAQKMNMSLSALKRNIKKSVGRSFSEMLKDYRLRKAITYLVRTDESLQQIATKCGFSSLSYFSYFFKEVNGVSPLRFRQNNQPEVDSN